MTDPYRVTELERRIEALEELLFALAHHLAIEAPHVAKPLALRVRIHSANELFSEAQRSVFRSVARLLEGI